MSQHQHEHAHRPDEGETVDAREGSEGSEGSEATGESPDGRDEELVAQARAAGVTVAPADEALGLHDSPPSGQSELDDQTDLFTVEMMSAWGDQWVWIGVDPTVSQEVFKMLGPPHVFHQVGVHAEDADTAEDGGEKPRHGEMHGPLAEE